jgi:hypothetical protein
VDPLARVSSGDSAGCAHYFILCTTDTPELSRRALPSEGMRPCLVEIEAALRLEELQNERAAACVVAIATKAQVVDAVLTAQRAAFVVQMALEMSPMWPARVTRFSEHRRNRGSNRDADQPVCEDGASRRP